jgi:hypothetical protein
MGDAAGGCELPHSAGLNGQWVAITQLTGNFSLAAPVCRCYDIQPSVGGGYPPIVSYPFFVAN